MNTENEAYRAIQQQQQTIGVITWVYVQPEMHRMKLGFSSPW
jgi:hypothetical protein